MAFAPPPVSDQIAKPARPEFRGGGDPLAGRVGDVWLEWFTRLVDDVDEATTRVNSVHKTVQGAAIGATDLTDGTATGGYYKITYYTRITRAATTSSSLTVTFSWTDLSNSPSQSGAAITGNTATTIQSGTLTIYSDVNSPITYATAYTSVGATSMQYRLDVFLEKVPT